MRGRSIENVAARLRAEASEHHGDGAEVRAVLACAFVGDEETGGYVYTQHDTPGEGHEDREAVKRALRDWIAAIDDPGAAIGFLPAPGRPLRHPPTLTSERPRRREPGHRPGDRQQRGRGAQETAAEGLMQATDERTTA